MSIYASLLVISMLALGGVWSQVKTPFNYDNNPCDANDHRSVMYPNFDDCSMFFECRNGVLNKDQKCPLNEVADYSKNLCVPKDTPGILDCEALTKV